MTCDFNTEKCNGVNVREVFLIRKYKDLELTYQAICEGCRNSPNANGKWRWPDHVKKRRARGRLTPGKEPHMSEIKKPNNPNPVRAGRYITVNKYLGIKGQLELTWKDRKVTAQGSAPGMAAHYLFSQMWITQKDINRLCIGTLAMVLIYQVYRGGFVSEEELFEVFNLSPHYRRSTHWGLNWLLVNRYLDCSASKDGIGSPSKSNGRYFFVTIKGQEMLNDYHNLCVEEMNRIINKQ
jgi:hypothetical protein